VAVHGDGARAELETHLAPPASHLAPPASHLPPPASRLATIRLGHGQLVSPQRELEARRGVRSRYAIAEDAVLFGVYGGLTPEKRLPQILTAFRALLPYTPS